MAVQIKIFENVTLMSDVLLLCGLCRLLGPVQLGL